MSSALTPASIGAASWATRSSLGSLVQTRGDSAALLVGGAGGEPFLPLSPDARAAARERSAATLAAARIAAGDRAVLSLNSDGDLGGALLAEAVVEAGASAAVVGPRGRMRLLAAMRGLRPNVWVTTPTGALDFLARLYLEFNVDPLELELERILVVGEIPSPGSIRRLGDEFESEVVGLYCDPFFGVALAHARGGKWQLQDGEVLALAPLDSDEWRPANPDDPDATLLEWVLRPTWCEPLREIGLRTGQVRTGAADPGTLFQHTVGDHVLARGRWLSLPLLRRALAGIDGIAAWTLALSRGEGTLDKVEIKLGFASGRERLVSNPMWEGRAREAIAAITPIAFELTSALVEGEPEPETLDDERGHHLGLDRAAVAAGRAR